MPPTTEQLAAQFAARYLQQRESQILAWSETLLRAGALAAWLEEHPTDPHAAHWQERADQYVQQAAAQAARLKEAP